MLVLIPAYEPTYRLIDVIKAIKLKTNYDILVIDDGSGENYQDLFEIAELLNCTVMHNEVNKGKGNALKVGFNYIIKNNINKSVICVDSDGQHHIDDIINVAKQIDINKKEMILGVRNFDNPIPIKSKVGNKITKFLFKVITKKDIVDTQTGLRGYPNSLLNWLVNVEGERFEYEMNLLINANQSNIDIRQVPILTIYENENKGTHFRPIKDSIKVYIPILKFLMSSLLSFVLDFILLFIFYTVTDDLLISVVVARVISATFNYTINKILVFNLKNAPDNKSAPKYFALATIILILNYIIMWLFINVIQINTIISKVLTEAILIIISYSIQRVYIFNKEKYIKRFKNTLSSSD